MSILEDPRFISALSPLVTSTLIALGYWGWRQFKNMLNENRALVASMDKKLDKLASGQKDHDELDSARFDNHAARLSKVEGATDVLIQILAAREGPKT